VIGIGSVIELDDLANIDHRVDGEVVHPTSLALTVTKCRQT